MSMSLVELESSGELHPEDLTPEDLEIIESLDKEFQSTYGEGDTRDGDSMQWDTEEGGAPAWRVQKATRRYEMEK